MVWSPAWSMVTCSRCGRSYTCTPDEDYYNSTCATDGVCEPCLLGFNGQEWRTPTQAEVFGDEKTP